MPFTNEEFWDYAVECWLRGEPEPIAKLLRGDEPVPPFARRWLAELALGLVKRQRGPKRKSPATAMLDSLRDLAINGAFEEALLQARPTSGTHGTPTELTLERVAADFDLSVDVVSKVVYPRKRKRLRIQGPDSSKTGP